MASVFAGALLEFGLPQESIFLSLFAFNSWNRTRPVEFYSTHFYSLVYGKKRLFGSN
jgi:hypothetical protein